MNNIVCFLNNFKIDSSNIISITLEKDDNNSLTLNLLISKFSYYKLDNKSFINCKILMNNKEYFSGNIKSIQLEHNLCSMQFVACTTLPVSQCDDNILIEKFKTNNPSLFQRRNEYNINSILTDIQSSIIKNSLKINIDKSLPINELELIISASWNKLCNGYCDLTNKIKHKLEGGLIKTLTPNKLIKSWPKLLDRIITGNKGIFKTKYFITHSKLDEYGSNTIKLNNDNKSIELKEVLFDYKLSIGWEYSQFTTEDLHCKIINNQVNNNNKQVLNINLHNVQEYIEDVYTNSFFRSEIGTNIFNIILCETKQFIINSMQNVCITFQIPFLDKLKINQLIKIYDYIVYISKISVSFTNNICIATVTCIGSECDSAFINASLQNIVLDNVNNNDNIVDIVENIDIVNTSEEQLQAINNIKDNKTINNILNENPTKVIIELKPIKTEHNKIEKIDIGTIELWNNTT